MTKVPLMILPVDYAVRLTGKWRGLFGQFTRIYPNIRVDLAETGLNIEADEYVGASAASSILTGLLFTALLAVVLYALQADPARIIWLSTLSGSTITALFFLALIAYPSILAGKRAELLERDLIYALKDMLLEISSGASIYSAINGVSESEYGEVSREFGRIVGKVNVGIPVEDGLRDLAVQSKSERLRNSIWQIVNSLKSGSSMEAVLRDMVKDLTHERKNRIRTYAQELNILVLVYMLFAVVIPTIATTLIIVLGPFVGMDAGPRLFYLILPACFFTQIILMEYIKSRRPVVYI
jgi:archaeal flagellar protein FlaJ